MLTLELLSENIHVSGATTAIRIIDGALSRGTIELKIGDRSQSFGLVIHNDTSLPIQATVTCNPQEVTASTPQVTLTAKATNLAALGLSEESLSYQWYHEGTLIEEADTSSLTLTDKKPGSHRYDVVIKSAKPGSIGSVTVTVIYPTS